MFAFVATIQSGFHARILGRVKYPNILMSFWYDKNGIWFRSKLGFAPPNAIGDSGAFSAWTKGVEIDLPRYIEWCKTNLERNPGFACVSLDVIPGSKLVRATPAHVEAAMAQSLLNGDTMRAAGLKIMEVYHQGEPVEFLDELLARRQPGEILCVSPRDGASTRSRRAFCEMTFTHLHDLCGWADLIPCHGLGIGFDNSLAVNYPWFSIDSSTWNRSERMGAVVTRSGKTVKRSTGQRYLHRKEIEIFIERGLRMWLRREAEVTAMWTQRGIRFRDEELIPWRHEIALVNV